jgi:L-alanine-DL-glutamate epimerase-like enolase superfamily enzyme
MRIERVEVYVVAPTSKRVAWASDLPEMFMTDTMVRIVSEDDTEGVGAVLSYSANGYDLSIAEILRNVTPMLVGTDPHDREATLAFARFPYPLPLGARAAINIALWDWLGKHTGVPVYKLLGGARNRILSYASTVTLESPEAYVDHVTQLREEGFKAVKFHVWCEPDRDLAMARAVRRVHSDLELKLMLDAETRYSRRDALRAAQELQDLGFYWFEAPFSDFDLEGYRELRRQVKIPIIPAGTWIMDLYGVSGALTSGAWEAARTNVCECGGISTAAKIMTLAQAAGRQCELECWGLPLHQAANLQTMLGLPNCTFFEQPVPYDAFEHGTVDTIRTRPDGYVYAPEGPGLGLQIDWDAIKAATLMKFETKGGK